MNTAPKSKTLIIIIAILLIANIATLSFFLMNKCGTKSNRQDRKAMITNYLKKEVGFNAEQLTRYDTLSKQHRTAMRSSLDGMSAGREAIFRKLASQEFGDSAIGTAADAISIQQRSFEVMMLHHLDDIRNICTPAQKLIFDTGFYKIISKRGEGRRN